MYRNQIIINDSYSRRDEIHITRSVLRIISNRSPFLAQTILYIIYHNTVNMYYIRQDNSMNDNKLITQIKASIRMCIEFAL